VTHLSKRVLKPEIESQVSKSLIYIIKTLDSDDEINNFLSTILSDTEKLMIAKRFIASYLLKHKILNNEICELLKLTPETVNRLKLRRLLAGNGFDSVLEKLETLKRNKIIKETLLKILNYAIVTGSGRVPNPFKPKSNKHKTPSIY